jgi:DNA-binding transcriptional ArsR family regulator
MICYVCYPYIKVKKIKNSCIYIFFDYVLISRKNFNDRNIYKENFKMKKLYFLNHPNEIKAYIHPTRITLLQMLAKEKRTISSIAKELNIHPANITHHFKLLEKEGLIRLVEKRDIGRNIEKYYRAIAKDFIVKPKSSNKEDKAILGLSVLKNDLVSAMSRIDEENYNKVLTLLGTAKINKVDFDYFMEKLIKLVDEFKKCRSKDGVQYTINMSIYPSEIKKSIKKVIKID